MMICIPADLCFLVSNVIRRKETLFLVLDSLSKIKKQYFRLSQSENDNTDIQSQ